MTAEPDTRILLVDDQELVRFGFRMLINAVPNLTVVGEGADGSEAIQLAERHRPDVILMDVRMPGMDGITATREIIARHPDCRIIMLTTFDVDEYAFGALGAGASGFLLKDARPGDLLTAIRTVKNGDAAVSGRVTRRMLDLFAAQLPQAGAFDAHEARLAELTPREREVLFAVADGLSNSEIGARWFVSESTVKTHVGRVLAKLGVRDRVHAAIYVYQNGLNRA